MSNYNSVTPEFIDELKTLLGETPSIKFFTI